MYNEYQSIYSLTLRIKLPNRVNNILNSMPSFFFFTDYLIILFLWYADYPVLQNYLSG